MAKFARRLLHWQTSAPSGAFAGRDELPTAESNRCGHRMSSNGSVEAGLRVKALVLASNRCQCAACFQAIAFEEDGERLWRQPVEPPIVGGPTTVCVASIRTRCSEQTARGVGLSY